MNADPLTRFQSALVDASNALDEMAAEREPTYVVSLFDHQIDSMLAWIHNQMERAVREREEDR